jgi:UDP-2-acetamido-3-amino-2,3-dideoxy-glucuronate N-acetyltransferase
VSPPAYFKHPQSIVEGENIGEGTRIWAFAHILPKASIGRDCNICDGVFIENDVTIGNRVTIKCGVQIWDGVNIEDDVFIGPNATFTNDNFPRSKIHLDKFPETRICRGASIGANATILPGLVIGTKSMIGAGAVVTRSVPPNAMVAGNPARIMGYVDAASDSSRRITPVQLSGSGDSVIHLGVKGVTIHRLPLINDLRGDLTVGEFERTIPFVPKRYFMVMGVPNSEVRGEHAHRKCHQFLIAARGSVSVVADDGRQREEIRLDAPNLGVYLPPMIWGIQYKYTADAVLLVFASDWYDKEDYIRDYSSYIEQVRIKDVVR